MSAPSFLTVCVGVYSVTCETTSTGTFEDQLVGHHWTYLTLQTAISVKLLSLSTCIDRKDLETTAILVAVDLQSLSLPNQRIPTLHQAVLAALKLEKGMAGHRHLDLLKLALHRLGNGATGTKRR